MLAAVATSIAAVTHAVDGDDDEASVQGQHHKQKQLAKISELECDAHNEHAFSLDFQQMELNSER